MMRLTKAFAAASLLLALASPASAQSGCGGQFGAGKFCGNVTGSTGLPGPALIPAGGTTPIAGGTVLGNPTASAAIPSATTAPVLGIPGTSTGQIGLAGATIGTATVKAQAAAGTPTLLLPNTSGTFAAGATTPLALSATTGVLTCPTCVTSSGGGAISGTSPILVSAAGVVSFDFTVANTFLAQQTAQGATTTSPGWYAQITGDTNSRIRVGMNATDVPSIAFGPGNAVRDAFIERVGAGSLRFGAPDAASPVAQTLGVQNVVAGTSNTAGANLTVNGSQGTGSGAGGSIIFQTAAAGGAGTSQNALGAALTLSAAKLATFGGHLLVEGVTSTGATGTGKFVFDTAPSVSSLTVTTAFTATGLVTNADLVNPATTVNGQTCTLGASCTVTASASSIDAGGATTTVTNGTANDILYITGTSPLYVNKIATANSSILVTNSSGVPSLSTTLPAITLGGSISGAGNTITNLASVGIRDTSAAFDVTLAATSGTILTAGRTLTLNMGNVAHTLAFGTTANTITFPNLASFTVLTNGDTGTVTSTILANSLSLVTPNINVATGTSLALGGGSIGSDALEITGSTTHNGKVTVNAASFGLSGNIATTAWTTNGVRYKNVAGTMTDTSSSGTVATAYTDIWGGNTIAASNATTFTNYYTSYFNAPAAGSNVTFTNKYALGADSFNATTIALGGSNLAGANPTATAGSSAVNGTAVTYMRSDAAPALALATNSTIGGMRGDGSTINCVSGVCTSVGSAASTVTVLSTTVAGGTAGNVVGITNSGCSGTSPCMSSLALTNQSANAPSTCDIISTSATTCNNGGSAANNGTYTVPTGAMWLEVTLVGGGAGGDGGGAAATVGTAGNNTCWNTTGAACTTPVYQAGGGAIGAATYTGGAGGVVSGSGTCGLAVPGGGGGGGGQVQVTAETAPGGTGGNSSLGGGGLSTLVGAGGGGATNSGGGGGGGSANTTLGGISGAGDGSGATCKTILTSLASTYTYAVAATAAAGTGTNAGGVGAAGRISVVAHFNF